MGQNPVEVQNMSRIVTLEGGLLYSSRCLYICASKFLIRKKAPRKHCPLSYGHVVSFLQLLVAWQDRCGFQVHRSVQRWHVVDMRLLQPNQIRTYDVPNLDSFCYLWLELPECRGTLLAWASASYSIWLFEVIVPWSCTTQDELENSQGFSSCLIRPLELTQLNFRQLYLW